MTSKINNNRIIITNPITNEEVGILELCTPSKFENIINIAKEYNDWSDLNIHQRCKQINKFRKAILKNRIELQSVLISETGKKNFDAFTELFTTLEHLRGITKIARKSLKKNKRNPGILKNKKAHVQYEPLGVAGIISPWNYPLVTPTTTISEALITGNNVILKPSEHTPLIMQYLKKLWDDNTNYKNAFQVIHGGADVGQMLIKSNNVDIICFTGSTAVGKKIAKQCSETLKPIILELGGKDPMIVLKDANQRRAVEAAIFGGLNNAGQACISIEQIFIEHQIFNEFTNKISKKIEQLRAGDTDNDLIGAIITPENCTKINEHLSELTDKTKIVMGQKQDHNMFIAPTIVIDPPPDSRIVNEETFGPVILIRPFNNETDLLEKIHKTGYGLSGSIFGKDKKRINKIIKKIKIGTISINDVFSHYGITSLPFGGEGNSGIGRLHGKEGLRSFCRVKSIVESKYHLIDDPWWFNRTKKIETALKKIISFLYR